MLKNRSMPSSIVIPELPYPDVNQAAEWLRNTFGFAERLRIGNHRAQLTFAEGSIVVTSQAGQSPAPYSLMVRVADVEAHHERARRQGARILDPPSTTRTVKGSTPPRTSPATRGPSPRQSLTSIQHNGAGFFSNELWTAAYQ